MNGQTVNQMIDLYFDGELEKGKEPILFTMLSTNEEAREYFKKMNSLKVHLDSAAEKFPAGLDEKILRSIENITVVKSNPFTYKKVFTMAAYTFTIVFLTLSILFYSRSEEYKVQFYDLTREVKEQNQRINMLLNALPQVEVEGSYVRVKEVIVTPKS